MEVRTVKDIGQAVKTARAALRLTQESAAALCGVSMPFMNQLEGGKRAHLSITKILGVCAGLGLDVHVIPTGERVHRDLKSSSVRKVSASHG